MAAEGGHLTWGVVGKGRGQGRHDGRRPTAGVRGGGHGEGCRLAADVRDEHLAQVRPGPRVGEDLWPARPSHTCGSCHQGAGPRRGGLAHSGGGGACHSRSGPTALQNKLLQTLFRSRHHSQARLRTVGQQPTFLSTSLRELDAITVPTRMTSVDTNNARTPGAAAPYAPATS